MCWLLNLLMTFIISVLFLTDLPVTNICMVDDLLQIMSEENDPTAIQRSRRNFSEDHNIWETYR